MKKKSIQTREHKLQRRGAELVTIRQAPQIEKQKTRRTRRTSTIYDDSYCVIQIVEIDTLFLQHCS
jgi:hypothetical protein